MNLAHFPGLQIESSLTTTKALNFKPDTWPPKQDFPVVIDANGNVVSRYGDVRWDLSPWSESTLTIFFGDGLGQGKKVSPENAIILRQIVAWWLWGEAATRSAKALVYKFETIKPLFVACTESAVLVTELHKYPRVIESLSNYYNQRANRLIDCLHSLYATKDNLGFSIIDESGMKLLISVLSTKESTQTAYIPPRIWSYQISRLSECLSDFITNFDKVEECYDFCLDAYARNAGGKLADAFGGLGDDGPFLKSRAKGKLRSGKQFFGSFESTAEKYGIATLLKRWVNLNELTGVSTISNYLTLISSAGMAYMLNFSLMRVDEGVKLRANCLEIELDDLGDDIHIISGVTSKTIEDDDARWIVSPTVELAIKAMKAVARLRLKAATKNPYIKLSTEDIKNPILQMVPHEPWNPKAPKAQPIKKYKKMRTYGEFRKMWPNLFDEKQLRITKADLEMANRMTFGLDSEKYALGFVWPLAWHQLRRTGAVNMLASGLVTEASLQYQLKHASRAMSQYYGKNFYHLKEPLSGEARGFYLREMYQSMVREFTSLQSDQYISPHGEKRKQQIISDISEKDHAQLLKAAKSGSISYRQTFLGGCANSGPPCPLGGISNISSCMGFGVNKACPSALLDKTKLPMIKQLKDVLISQSKDSDIGTLYHDSLQAQLESAERAIDVIEKDGT